MDQQTERKVIHHISVLVIVIYISLLDENVSTELDLAAVQHMQSEEDKVEGGDGWRGLSSAECLKLLFYLTHF